LVSFNKSYLVIIFKPYRQ